MLSRTFLSILLFSGAMQQIASPQTATMSRSSNTARQILALEDRGHLSAATALTEKLISDLKRDTPTNKLLPAAMDRLASLQRRQGKYAEAERSYETAVQLWQKRPGSPGTGLATELDNLASFYSEMGQFEKAKIARRHSLTLRLRLLGPESPAVALSYSNLASDLFWQGKYSEAEKSAHQAIEIWRRGPAEKCQEDLGYHTLAMVRLHAGDYGQARKLIRLALRAYAQHDIRDGARLAEYQHALALIEEASGDSLRAAQSFQASLATLTRANRTQSLEAIGILKDYASLLRRMGRGSEARKVEGRANKESKQLMKDNPFRYSVDVSTLIREHR